MEPQDEELPQPGKDPKRLRIELAAGAVLLLIVLFAVKATTGKSGKVGGPSPSPTSSATHSYGTGAPDSGSGLLDGQSTYTYGPVTTVTLDPSEGAVVSRNDGLPDRVSDDPAACPWPTGSDGNGHAVPGCTEDDSEPAHAVSAVLAVYPNAKLSSATTVYLGKTVLWFRQLNVYVGTAELLVRVEAPPPNGLPADVSGEQDGMTSYSGSLGPHHVYLQINRTGQSAALAKLAKDVRLTQ